MFSVFEAAFYVVFDDAVPSMLSTFVYEKGGKFKKKIWNETRVCNNLNEGFIIGNIWNNQCLTYTMEKTYKHTKMSNFKDTYG